MKKGKLILSVIGILSLLGGIIAFRAQKFMGTWYCRTATGTNVLCIIIATTDPAQVTTFGYCTKLRTTTCSAYFSILRNQ